MVGDFITFFRKFKIGKYDVNVVRLHNSGKKVPRHIDKWEYWFFVETKGKRVLTLDVPANNIDSAKKGLKGAMEVRKLIPERKKRKPTFYKSKEGIIRVR